MESEGSTFIVLMLLSLGGAIAGINLERLVRLLLSRRQSKAEEAIEKCDLLFTLIRTSNMIRTTPVVIEGQESIRIESVVDIAKLVEQLEELQRRSSTWQKPN